MEWCAPEAHAPSAQNERWNSGVERWNGKTGDMRGKT
jgi:hypothetical protein